MAPNIRVKNAFMAMKTLGISEDVVKPVLKKLLKVFEMNWDPIEEENYRALADAVFEYQEANVGLQKRKLSSSNDEEDEAQQNDEHERLLKRTRRPQVGNGMSTAGNSSVLRSTELEPEGSSRNYHSQHPERKGASTFNAANVGDARQLVRDGNVSRLIESQSLSSDPLVEREKTIASHPVIENGAQMYANAMKAIQGYQSSSTSNKDKEKIISSPAPDKKKRPMREKPPQVICLKEPKVEPGITPRAETVQPLALALIPPRDEIAVDCPTLLSSPNRHPDSSNGDCSARDNGAFKSRASPTPCQDQGDKEPGCSDYSDRGTVLGHSDTDATKVSSVDLAFASSVLGEVRISLSCTHSSQTDFRMPSVEAILKLAAEKIANPANISSKILVTEVIRDVCNAYLELGSKPKEPQEANRMFNPSCTKDLANTYVDNVNSMSVPSQSVDTFGLKAAPKNQRNPPPMDFGNNKKRSAYKDTVNNGEETRVEMNGHANKSLQNVAIVADITDGKEEVKISLVNEINNKPLPIFTYLTHSVVFGNANLDISLGRIGDGDCCKSCIGDCLASKNLCACASRAAGNFVYTLDGLLKEDFLEESDDVLRNHQKHLQFCSNDCLLVRSGNDYLPLPCNGHLARKFIKECWKKCGCNKLCTNRLVQRGVTRKLQVFMTPDGKGWGLRTLEELPKGAFVCEYAGEILTLMELRDRYAQNVNNKGYNVLLDTSWGADKVLQEEETVCIDGTYYGNVARFINHRCSDSNLIDIPVEVESPDHHYYHIAFFTRRKVNAFEELTWDYGIDFGKNCNHVKTFQCKCGSEYCRDMIYRNSK